MRTHRSTYHPLDEPATGDPDVDCCRSTSRCDGCPHTGGNPNRPRLTAGRGLREVFARPGYRRLWAARIVSQWGDTLNVIALARLVYDLTGSALGVSGVVAAEIAPVLLLAPFAVR